MKKMFIAAMAAAFFAVLPAGAQTVNSDSWAATDALGRKVRSYDDAPAKRDGKFVAIFYWTWHDVARHNEDWQVKNITEIVRQYPEAMRDINAKAQETWDEAYKSFDSGNFVNVEEMLKTVGDYVATQTNNAMAKAIDAVDATADNWVKEWAKIKGIDLEHWSDMTIGQLNAVRDALKGLFDENGNLIEAVAS